MIVSDFYVSIVKDIIRGIIEDCAARENVAQTAFEEFLNEEISQILRSYSQQMLMKRRFYDEVFDDIIDTIITGERSRF